MENKVANKTYRDYIALRLTSDTRQKLEKLAAIKDMPVSTLARSIIDEYLKTKGV